MSPRDRLPTLPALTAPPPLPPATSIEAKVRDLEEFRREQHRTNTDLVREMNEVNATLVDLNSNVKEMSDTHKAFTRQQKWLSWATRIVLGAALIYALTWFGKVAAMVQAAKLP